MNFNKPTLALLFGALATIPFEIFTRLMVYLGIGKYSVYELCSLIVTLNRPNAILGSVTTIIVGACVTIIFYYLLKKIGWDYLVIKSIAASLISWLIFEAVFMWLLEGRNLISYRPINDYYSELVGSVIFGVTIGLLFKKYFLMDNELNIKN